MCVMLHCFNVCNVALVCYFSVGEGTSHNDMPLEMEGKIDELKKICERMVRMGERLTLDQKKSKML